MRPIYCGFMMGTPTQAAFRDITASIVSHIAAAHSRCGGNVGHAARRDRRWGSRDKIYFFAVVRSLAINSIGTNIIGSVCVQASDVASETTHSFACLHLAVIDSWIMA